MLADDCPRIGTGLVEDREEALVVEVGAPLIGRAHGLAVAPEVVRRFARLNDVGVQPVVAERADHGDVADGSVLVHGIELILWEHRDHGTLEIHAEPAAHGGA